MTVDLVSMTFAPTQKRAKATPPPTAVATPTVDKKPSKVTARTARPTPLPPSPATKLATKTQAPQQRERERSYEAKQPTSSNTQATTGASQKTQTSIAGLSIGAKGTSTGFGTKSPLEAYRKAIYNILLQAQRYPSSARRNREQGEVLMSFVIHPDGHSSDITVVNPSPFRALNREGKALIRRVKRFPPFPNGLADTPMTISVNIPFRLLS